MPVFIEHLFRLWDVAFSYATLYVSNRKGHKPMREKTVEFKGEQYTLKDLPMVGKRIEFIHKLFQDMRADKVMPTFIVESQTDLYLEAVLLAEMIIDKFTDADRKAQIRLVKRLLKVNPMPVYKQ